MTISMATSTGDVYREEQKKVLRGRGISERITQGLGKYPCQVAQGVPEQYLEVPEEFQRNLREFQGIQVFSRNFRRFEERFSEGRG